MAFPLSEELNIDEIVMLIKPQPFLKVLEVGCGRGAVSNRVAQHIASQDGEIDLFEVYPDGGQNDICITEKNVEIKKISDIDESLILKAGNYEIVILTAILDKIDMAKELLKKCYKSMEVSAILIALCHESSDDNEKIESLLDEAHFVAMNRIDMRDGYFLATANKIYNWDEDI